MHICHFFHRKVALQANRFADDTTLLYRTSLEDILPKPAKYFITAPFAFCRFAYVGLQWLFFGRHTANLKSYKGYKDDCIFYTRFTYLNYWLTEALTFFEEFLVRFISKWRWQTNYSQFSLRFLIVDFQFHREFTGPSMWQKPSIILKGHCW